MITSITKSLLVASGAFALVSMLAPTEASAQSRCYTQRGHSPHGYSRSYHRPARSHHYRAPRRATVCPTTRRIITHSHYGGPIYYRYPSATYIAPRTTVRYYSSRVTRPSYGSRHYRRCR